MSIQPVPVALKLAAALGLAALVLAPLAFAAPAPASAAAAPTAAAPPAAGAREVPEIQFEKYTLPNGLQVILHVDRKLPIVHVNQWYHVGSKNEKPGRTGFAHLFEHMMFQGSKNVAAASTSRCVEELGANLQEGGVNGTTNNDRTNYFATVPSGNLEKLLWLESRPAGDAARRRSTRRSSTTSATWSRTSAGRASRTSPTGAGSSSWRTSSIPAGHPYSWPVIGSQEDLTAASLDDVKEFFRTYYTPNNLSLVIAGDFDPAEAKRLVEKYFGSIPPGPALGAPEGVADPTLAAREDRRGRRPRAAGARLHGLADAASSSARATPSSISPRASSPTACRRGSTRRSSTTRQLGDGRQRLPVSAPRSRAASW